MIDQTLHSSRTGKDWDPKTYLKEVFSGKRKLVASKFCGDTYPVLWYFEVARMKGIPVKEVSKDTLRAGDTVLAWEPSVKEHIASHYEHEVLDTLHSLQIINIRGVQ